MAGGITNEDTQLPLGHFPEVEAIAPGGRSGQSPTDGLKPRNAGAGRKIRGVGEVKAEKYLAAFIEVIVAQPG